jgi:hypothetical protein
MKLTRDQRIALLNGLVVAVVLAVTGFGFQAWQGKPARDLAKLQLAKERKQNACDVFTNGAQLPQQPAESFTGASRPPTSSTTATDWTHRPRTPSATAQAEGLTIVADFAEDAQSTIPLDERRAGAAALDAMLRLGTGVPAGRS